MSQKILDDPSEGVKDPLGKVQFASFWVRAGAVCIDVFVFIPVLGLNVHNIFTLKSYFLSLTLGIIATVYKPLMEWKFGATIGKMAMKTKVVNVAAKPINWEQSMARFVFFFAVLLVMMMNSFTLFHAPGFEGIQNAADLASLQQQHTNGLLSEITMYILFFSTVMAAFDMRSQALHDKLARTFCVRTV